MKIEVKITHSLDEDGDPIVSVPLTNVDKKAILYQEDFNRLYEAGLDPRWRLSNGQILERGKSRISIARLVADAKAGEKVQYRDRDGCNLKRDNLVIAVGGAKSKTKDKLAPMNRPHKLNDTVELTHIYNNPSWA